MKPAITDADLKEMLTKAADENGIVTFTINTEIFTPEDWKQLDRLLQDGTVKLANHEALI